MFRFDHFNFNILDLDRSLRFYDEALGLKPVRSRDGDGFRLVFLGDGKTDFSLELTWMLDRSEPYDLGEQEYHLALTTTEYDAAYARHQAMGCVAQEDNGRFYFITDPDGYWIEIIRRDA